MCYALYYLTDQDFVDSDMPGRTIAAAAIPNIVKSPVVWTRPACSASFGKAATKTGSNTETGRGNIFQYGLHTDANFDKARHPAET